MRKRSHAGVAFACTVFACVVVTTINGGAQDRRPAARQSPDSVVVNTDEVLFDVVVRDKRGRVVNDLTASDFEVYEDGVRQELNSFRLVAPASATENADGGATPTGRNNGGRAGGAGATSSTPESAVANGVGNVNGVSSGANGVVNGAGGVSAVAFVFDRLSPDARARAYKAALNYLDESANRGELFGVFVTDLSALVLQPFTDDRELVKSGLEKAGLHNPSLYTSNNVVTRAVREQETVDMLRAQQGRGAGPEQKLRTSSLTLLEFIEEMERNQQGNATTRGLLFVASSLRALPGRKAVIFFSEGMILPPSTMETFRAVINAANRNNVSFYTVDAAGLRTESKTAETTKEIISRSDHRMAELGLKGDPGSPMTKGLERNEDILRFNPDSGLGQLANQTGGFLITDSNDLSGRLRRVDEDLHSYYLLSYAPKNLNYDGHFRKIEVKLRRTGLAVQSRKGYFAIKGTFASPVLSYEAPALAALEKTPKADAFPFLAAGFSFPERERAGLAPVLVDVPLSAFTFRADAEKKLYETDFSVVALLKDQAGQVVEKLSKQYRLTGPIDKVEAEKQGRVLFYREAELEPGRYTLEVVAYDAPTGRASVRTGAVEVPAGEEGGLRLSDVVFLKRAEPAGAGEEKRGNPFRVADMIVSPNLGEPIRRSLRQAPFFFTAYTRPGAARPKLTIELRQQGRTLAQMPGDLPEPDAAGRIQYLAGLPLEKIPAGTYELRVTIGDAATTVTRSGYFTLED
ncbi:MAG TPA: VWA domain-containing protein [Pyrinomonadaceae bacterium]|nr:VWA domain-containing protein [Pyrinomonadaceae bacterium]